MKFLVLITIFCALIAVNTAAVAQGYYNNSNHPGKCVVDDVILSPGEKAQNPKYCGRMLCGNSGLVTFHTCGVEIPPEGYKLGEPIMPKANYPYCCRRAFVPIV